MIYSFQESRDRKRLPFFRSSERSECLAIHDSARMDIVSRNAFTILINS